ncbi:MAG: asparagine synthase-related protein [Rhodothermales bacterium]|nr:asparagine synthase-related protein [Rhodothermales bacterium]
MLDGRPAERGGRGMLDALVHRGACAALRPDGPMALGHRQRPAEPACPVAHDGRYAVAADARIDNREDLARAMGLAPRGPELRALSTAEVLLKAYATWGGRCVEHLVGDYAFVVWDAQERALFGARDPLGVRPLYYAFRPGVLFACASEIKGVLATGEVPRRVNETRIADYLAVRGEDARATFYADVLRLPGGHTLTLRQGGTPQVRRFWEPPSPALRRGSDAELEAGFRARFEEAVRARLPEGPAGVLLSGGLDSSAVAGVAARLHDRPVHGFSATFPDLPEEHLRVSDERGYVAAVSRFVGLESHLVPLTGTSPLDALEQYLAHLDQPPFLSNLYLLHRLQSAAREAGVRVLLDGVEGDDIVSHGVERLWELGYRGRWDVLETEAQALAARTNGTATGLFRRFGERGAKARARAHPLRFVREAPRVARLADRPLRHVLWTYGLKPWLRPLARRVRPRPTPMPALLSADFARRTGYRERLEAYAEIGRSTDVSAQGLHRLALSAGAGPTATILEETSHLAAMDGVERRHPFYDVRLLEYCLSLPADQKLRDGWTRSILRRALADDLPETVRARTDKADLSPNFFRNLLQMERERVGQLTTVDGDLLAPYVDPAAFRAALERNDAPLLWRLVMLAHWLKEV